MKSNYNVLAADIICIAETWLKPSNITQNYTIKEHNTFWLDEETTQIPYHGLMLYVHKSIKLHQISKYPGDELEAINVTISKNSAKFSIVGLQNSLTTSMVEWISSVEAILPNCDWLPLTIIGDFNLDVSNGANKTFVISWKASTTATSMSHNQQLMIKQQ